MWLVVPLGLLLVTLIATELSASWDVYHFNNDSYEIDSRCTASNNLPGVAMLSRYRAEMADWGWSNSIFYPVQHPMFVDPDLFSGGQDYEYIDDARIAWMTGHGGTSGTIPAFFRMKLQTFESSVLESCYLAPEFTMRLGDQGMHLDWLHVISCHSLQTDDNSYQSWRSVFTGVHQIHGFHGLAWFRSANSNLAYAYEDFAHDSHSAALALEWVAELFFPEEFEDPFGSGIYHDQCPVAYVGRDTVASALTILNNEKYPIPDRVPPSLTYSDEFTPTH